MDESGRPYKTKGTNFHKNTKKIGLYLFEVFNIEQAFAILSNNIKLLYVLISNYEKIFWFFIIHFSLLMELRLSECYNEKLINFFI